MVKNLMGFRGQGMASEHADMDIADSDNFPDGSYEVTVAGRTIPLTRREGFSLARQ
jgi:hypothetical protein